MTLFTNSSVIKNIVQGQGVDQNVNKEYHAMLQTLVELQTRQLIQAAAKFMRRDRRDTLSLDDIQLALREINHSDLIITPTGQYKDKDDYAVKEDKLYTSPATIMEQQLKLLRYRQLQGPRLAGRWIYLKGKVPSTGQNVNIKKLQQLKESGKHEYEQKRKLCNIIKDDPYSFLNSQQSQFFMNISKVISADSLPPSITVEGDLTNLMPFMLQLIGEKELTDVSMTFFLKLIENKYIWRSIQFYAVKTLHLLLAYKGTLSFGVGIKIAQIVDKLCEKYPKIRDIYVDYEDNSYSTILKKIPFELILGVTFNIDLQLLQRCRADADSNDQMAMLCMQILLENSSQLTMFRKLLASSMNTFIYWHPCPELKHDSFLGMY